MTFNEAAAAYISTLTQPRSRALSPNTVRIYTLYAKRLTAHFGALPLAEVRNGKVKEFILALHSEGLKPSAIAGIFNVLRQIVYSVTDFDGEQIYTQKFKKKFLTIPAVKPTEQPCACAADVERALQQGNFIHTLIPFLASTGLRVSEALSLEIGAGAGNFYDPTAGIINLRVGLKTDAATRSVLLSENFRTWLNQRIQRSGKLFPQTYQQVHDALKSAKLPQAHAFRRLRITWCRKAGMSESVLRRQVGHSDSGITSRYDRSGIDEAFVRSEVNRVGLGFTLTNQAKEEAA
jgi:integrase